MAIGVFQPARWPLARLARGQRFQEKPGCGDIIALKPDSRSLRPAMVSQQFQVWGRLSWGQGNDIHLRALDGVETLLLASMIYGAR